jgi:hypothetical protein
MKRQQQFLLSIFAIALALFLVIGHKSGFAADRPNTHNMLVVGEKVVYLSHLPMFQEPGNSPMPHRYQMILDVELDRQNDYTEDRRRNPSTTIYTLNPEQFVLPELVSPELQNQSLSSFNANKVFRGHLERQGSVPILNNVGVTVKRVVYFREFDPKAKKPEQLEYLLFGKGKELFLAHLIVAPPDFDQVLSVKLTNHQFSDEELAKGVPVVFPRTRNNVGDRLRANQKITGEITAGSRAVRNRIQVEVGRELYFEEGELRVPPVFNTTPEERRSGFP